jgi:hypothetical protein
MADFTQIPGELNIEVGLGDDLSMLIDFDIVLTGYTFIGKVIHIDGVTETNITITNTDLSTGKITISMTDAQIDAIGAYECRWYLEWTTGTASRRVLAGKFTIIKYP